ncbi:MAG: flagellar FliJ family protein [Phycisphaerales bacterium]
MARFVFKLDPVLEQRRREERDHMRKVAELERERLALEDEIRAHRRAMEQERDDLRDLLAGGGSVDLRGARMQASASIRQMALAQRAVLRLAGVHKQLLNARGALIEASKRRKSVEALRDRRLAQWKLDRSRAEDRELDDLSVMRYEREAS